MEDNFYHSFYYVEGRIASSFRRFSYFPLGNIFSLTIKLIQFVRNQNKESVKNNSAFSDGRSLPSLVIVEWFFHVRKLSLKNDIERGEHSTLSGVGNWDKEKMENWWLKESHQLSRNAHRQRKLSVEMPREWSQRERIVACCSAYVESKRQTTVAKVLSHDIHSV